MDNNLLTVKQIIEQYPDFSSQKINFLIREGRLKAKKIGTKYYINREVWNQFIGISTNIEDTQKDIELIKLKAELENLQIKYNAICAYLRTANSLIA